MYHALKRDNHLKYSARRQFGLFLKGIGLSLEESLKFWRNAFERKVPKEKFDKDYAYNIRYNYGKEGKRADYTPYNCSKIISGTAPGQGEHHGCPFKTFDARNLQEKLAFVGISASSSQNKEIVELASQGHYQVACQRYYLAMHAGAVTENVGNHPNSYFKESRLYHEGAKVEGGTDTSSQEDVAISQSQSSQ
jgi:DNA primase large subunit